MGICEKHQLPLDEHGECELCRLSMVPSNAPPTSSAWWALIIPLVLLGAGIVWALSSLGSEPEVAPQRGVRTAEPRPSVPDPVRPTPSEPEQEPEITPTSPEPPVPSPNIPSEDIPIPEPPEDETPESTRLDQLPRAPHGKVSGRSLFAGSGGAGAGAPDPRARRCRPPLWPNPASCLHRPGLRR